MFIDGCAAEVVSIGDGGTVVVSIGKGGTAVLSPCSGDGVAVSPGGVEVTLDFLKGC